MSRRGLLSFGLRYAAAVPGCIDRTAFTLISFFICDSLARLSDIEMNVKKKRTNPEQFGLELAHNDISKQRCFTVIKLKGKAAIL